MGAASLYAVCSRLEKKKMMVVVGIQLSWAVGHRADRPHRGLDTEVQQQPPVRSELSQKTAIVIMLIGW